MRKLIHPILRAAAALSAALVCMVATAQAPARPPTEAFFRKPAISEARISPTGRHVAFLSPNKDGRLQLLMLDTEKLSVKAVTSFDEADVVNVHWISDKRLVFSASDADNVLAGMVSPGLYAVDADGTDFRRLARVDRGFFQAESSSRALLDYTTRMLSTTWNEDSDDMFVVQAKFDDATQDLQAVNVLRLNTRTGATRRFTRPGDSLGWTVDPTDTPRITVTREGGGRGAIQYLDPATDKWVKLSEFDMVTGEGSITPVGFATDGTLYVSHRKPDGFDALYTYDLKQKKLSDQPAATVEGFDVDARLLVTKKGLVGLRYVSDAEATYWVDPQLKELQAKIDRALPGRTNRIDVPFRAEVPLLLVTSFSDRNPGDVYLYNIALDKLSGFGNRLPGIEQAAMGRREFVRYKARDGLPIPAWLTTPRDGTAGKRPLVVLVHGGPWIRGGYWRFDPESQFLASRGYAVIEPEFRGSTGYGFNHFKAGWKQWGLAMQNDVADAVRWAVDKGIADPARVCIAGASYGGYAVLMGLVNDPDLYKCGVEWVGVTDIDLMYSITWSDSSDEYKQYGMPVLVGDREKDAAQIKATSPIQQAARIKQPLLMAYGGRDQRVPIEHGRKLKAAVEKTNPNVEWIFYEDEGHGWSQAKNRIDFWNRVEKFLDRNIGAK